MECSSVEWQNRVGTALASLFCMSSAEASIPMLCPSSTCEETSVVVASSPELYTEQNLALLGGRFIGVTSLHC